MNKELSEDRIQQDFFNRCWNELPQTRNLLFSIPNGGTRNRVEAMKFKATGLIAGQPDMIFVWLGKVYGIEFKTPTGVLSPNQIKVHQAWKANGNSVEVFRSSDEAFEYVSRITHNQRSGVK